MNPLAILGIAAGVGLIVYALSLRNDDETLPVAQVRPDRPKAARQGSHHEDSDALGFGQFEPPPPPSEHLAYVPVSTDPETVRSRLLGLGGLILLVLASAAVLALAMYQAGHIINQTLARYLNK